ncbi:hypothetical protein SNE25_14985 [Mucilaginibacter sabulilitoris]|uniref:Uncharacterized protein n=1 Tax=Mucilaginibacter sabulilitoris TaxID=1173583 RepID=A0ABZ0TUS1_9SPHI|nr:hypothetical protein [Mucilaginibacter sabulilitoris]WPU96826.1 hypothetical protein SNE25_14985 [Mucilaginibacter sabulilitoris]
MLAYIGPMAFIALVILSISLLPLSIGGGGVNTTSVTFTLRVPAGNDWVRLTL